MNSGEASSSVVLMSDLSLQQAIWAVAPDALLVDPRIIRRVIRLDRRLKGLGLRVPHDQSYTIDRARLLAYVDRAELEPVGDLAPMMILLNRPTEQVNEIAGSRSEILLHYWRLLFQSRVHLELERRYPEAEQRNSLAQARRIQLGELVFAEIRTVLLHDRLLFSEHTDWEVYREFAAVALDAKYFAPETLNALFPVITDWNAVDAKLSLDINHEDIYQTTRLLPANAEQLEEQVAKVHARQHAPSHSLDLGTAPREASSRDDRNDYQQRAIRAGQFGNHLKAAIYWKLAANARQTAGGASYQQSSLSELKLLIDKLRTALRQDESSIDEWTAGLSPVLELATSGFWSAEARLLYDLQKICVESDAESRRANLFGWLTSFGREPLTRSMPLLKFVQLAKHIRSAQRRLGKTVLEKADRDRIGSLLDQAEELAESLLRETIRPVIHDQLDRVALLPENVPERVARHKLVEEMLDNLVEYGYLTSSMFRDALSKGDLKLRDVSGRQLLIGDQFLLADRGLSVPLDGIYRPAPIYMRWSQRLSSLAFGTSFGRFITMHLALPLGGAFLAVEGVRHVIAMFRGDHHGGPQTATNKFPAETAAETTLETVVETAVEHVAQSSPTVASSNGYMTAVVLATGLLIYLLMHRPKFRSVCVSYCVWAMHGLRQVIVELPTKLLRIPLIEQLLYGPVFAPLRNYLLKPGLATAFLLFLFQPIFPFEDFRNVLVVFLLNALFLNSQAGRHADEWFTDLVLRVLDDLRAKVFGVILQWILDLFQRLLIELDRILHTLDEWSRFRTRDSRFVQVGKFIAGSLWAIIAYFVVLVSTLLVEPQINPIKHFPVVTVSHKLLLPLGPFFVSRLSPFIGATQANTWVWSTIWLIPGMFGFLVWELRGNWRLYAANRARTLQPQAVGHHGESMVAMLRPTFHSGTLPKLFARLRRAARKPKKGTGKWQLARHQAALKVNQRRVQHFVERELLELLRQSETFEALFLEVHSVQLATNRIQVAIWNPSIPESMLFVTWEESNRQLVANVIDDQMLDTLSASQRDSLKLALSGLFQRTGVEAASGSIGTTTSQPIDWNEWASWWSKQNPF